MAKIKYLSVNRSKNFPGRSKNKDILMMLKFPSFNRLNKICATYLIVYFLWLQIAFNSARHTQVWVAGTFFRATSSPN